MIVFDPLWKTLKDKGISQYALHTKYGLSTGTISALHQNKSITLNTLNDLCKLIGCTPFDVIAYVPDAPEDVEAGESETAGEGEDTPERGQEPQDKLSQESSDKGSGER